MSNITKPVMLDETGQRIAKALEPMNDIAAALNDLTTIQGQIALRDWKSYQMLLQRGVAARQCPVGTKLGITHSIYGAFNYIVAGYDIYPDPHHHFDHSALLVPDIAVVNSLQYDAAEALYYCVDGLAAGTYHFTLLPGYDTGNGGGATYQFTLTKPVPAGGQICFPWGGKAVDTKISTYENRTSTTAIETVSVTVGTGGTDLGTADGNTTNMNHAHRIRYGSNNWKESAIRQFLNSRASAGSVWHPQTIFDRPPSWAANTAGWMAGLPDDFLAVVGDTDVTTRTNSVFEVNDPLNSSYVTRDKFFLLSNDEAGFGKEGGIAQGERLPLFADATNADRIMYNASGAVRYWWLRSPGPGHASSTRYVHTDGSLLNGTASYASAALPACVIR